MRGSSFLTSLLFERHFLVHVGQQVGGPCLASRHVGKLLTDTAGLLPVITTFHFQTMHPKSANTQTLRD